MHNQRSAGKHIALTDWNRHPAEANANTSLDRQLLRAASFVNSLHCVVRVFTIQLQWPYKECLHVHPCITVSKPRSFAYCGVGLWSTIPVEHVAKMWARERRKLNWCVSVWNAYTHIHTHHTHTHKHTHTHTLTHAHTYTHAHIHTHTHTHIHLSLFVSSFLSLWPYLDPA